MYDSKQGTGQRRGQDLRDPPSKLHQPVGPAEMLFGHQQRRCRRKGRPLKRGKGRVDAGQQVNVPDLELSGQEQKKQAQGREAGAQVADDHGPAPIPAVHKRAGQRRQDDAGQHRA